MIENNNFLLYLLLKSIQCRFLLILYILFEKVTVLDREIFSKVFRQLDFVVLFLINHLHI